MKGTWTENQIIAIESISCILTIRESKKLTRNDMSSNRMRMQVERVNLKINPVERKGLYETKYRFAEERIDTHTGTTLVQDSQNA